MSISRSTVVWEICLGSVSKQPTNAIANAKQWLYRVAITEFDADGEGTWLRFAYSGYLFSIGEFGSRARLTVNDADCSPELLIEVAEPQQQLISVDLSALKCSSRSSAE
jgi:hypothetical protein